MLAGRAALGVRSPLPVGVRPRSHRRRAGVARRGPVPRLVAAGWSSRRCCARRAGSRGSPPRPLRPSARAAARGRPSRTTSCGRSRTRRGGRWSGRGRCGCCSPRSDVDGEALRSRPSCPAAVLVVAGAAAAVLARGADAGAASTPRAAARPASGAAARGARHAADGAGVDGLGPASDRSPPCCEHPGRADHRLALAWREHRALVLAVPSAGPAGGQRREPARRRRARRPRARRARGDVVQRVAGAGRLVHRASRSATPPPDHVRPLRRLAAAAWLDAMDSWLLVERLGRCGAGTLSYAARAVARRRPAGPHAGGRPGHLDLGGRPARPTAAPSAPGGGWCCPAACRPPPSGPSGTRRAVVVGDWGYPPNRDGLRWLVEHVLPRTSVRPSTSTGRPPAARRAAARARVRRGPRRDVRRPGDVHLGPVRFGGGVKRKVLQPLLAGLPVVTTTAGAHGLRPHPLLDVADDPARLRRGARPAAGGPGRRRAAGPCRTCSTPTSGPTWSPGFRRCSTSS